MSRVEDDREAARTAARLAEAKRTEETKKSEKQIADSTFKKLVGKQQEGTHQAREQSTARDAIAHLLQSSEADAAAEAKEAAGSGERAQAQGKGENAFKAKLGSKGQEEKVNQASRHEGESTQAARAAEGEGQSAAQAGRAADSGAGARSAEGRKADSRSTSARLDERKESSDASAAGRAGGASGEKGEIKADADKGGGGGQQGKDQKDGAGAMNPGFRFNPALMAPVPVAKQKDASGSERLRKVANEIAQKIVERVRVGTNASGKVEMQIDLRSNVLAGLSVKVSSHQGKIKAVFSGSDKEVLKMLEEQGEALKSALGARGLTLEELKIEART